MAKELTAKPEGGRSHRRWAYRQVFDPVQRWLDAQRASSWITKEIQNRWRALGTERQALVAVLRNLSGQRSRNLSKLVEFNRWNRDRHGRHRTHFAVWLVQFVAVLHPAEHAAIDQAIGGEVAAELTIEDELAQTIADVAAVPMQPELRAALVAHAVLERRVRAMPPRSDPGDEADAEDEKSDEQQAPGAAVGPPEGHTVGAEFDERAASILAELAALPPEDRFWDQVDAFSEQVGRLAAEALRRRGLQDTQRRLDMARQVHDALAALQTEHGAALSWLALEQVRAPDEVKVSNRDLVFEGVQRFGDALAAFTVDWKQQAQSDLHERELFARRRARSDAAREAHAALRAQLELAAHLAGVAGVERGGASTDEAAPASEQARDTTTIYGATMALDVAEAATNTDEAAAASDGAEATVRTDDVAVPTDAPIDRPAAPHHGTVSAFEPPAPHGSTVGSDVEEWVHAVPVTPVVDPLVADAPRKSDGPITDAAQETSRLAPDNKPTATTVVPESSASGRAVERRTPNTDPIAAAHVVQANGVLAGETATAGGPSGATGQSEGAPAPTVGETSKGSSSAQSAAGAVPRPDPIASLWTLLSRGDEAGAAVLARALVNSGAEVPVPWATLAALQASRWFDAEASLFVGDLADIVAQTTPAEDAAHELLTTAAALVPVLVAPETNLRAWLDRRTVAPLANVVTAIANFADRGQRLDRKWLDGVVDAGEQKQQAEELQRRAQRLISEAQHRNTKYHAATNVWREFFRRRLRPVLERVATGDASVIEEAERLVHRLGTTTTLTKELNTIDRQLRPGVGDEIAFGAREQLHGHVHEVLGAIEAWARQARTVLQFRQMDWLPAKVAELRASVAGAIGDAERYADELVCSGSTAMAACGSALRRSLADLSTLLRLGQHARPQAAIPELEKLARDASSLEDAIGARCLWCPAIRGPEQIARSPEFLAATLLELPATIVACCEWISHERFDEAGRLAAHAGPEAQELLVKGLERARILLRDERDALRLTIEQGVLDGYVGEERARLLGVVERVDPAAATDIERARFQLRAAENEVEHARRTRLGLALERWEQLEKRMRQGGAESAEIAALRHDILAKHAQGDIRVIDETLALIDESGTESRATPFAPVQADVLRSFRAFSSQAEQALQRGWGALKKLLVANELHIAGRTFPVGEKRQPVLAALDAWYALKHEGSEGIDDENTKRVRTVLLFVGFLAEGGGPDRILERKRPGVRQMVGRYSHGGFSPVPQFGSQARQELRTVCVWERPGVDTLTSIFAEIPPSGPPVVVFYFGRLTDSQRGRLRTLGRERQSVVFLDEILMLFLAGEHDARLRAFFACTLPYACLNPYTPFQAGEVPPEMYFGRRELVLELHRPEGSCIVYGGRQLGKSALLREVARTVHDPARKQYAIVIDVVGIGNAAHGRDATAFWSLLRDRLKEVGAFETRRANPDELVKALREAFARDPDLRVLVLLDEADQLLDADARDRFLIVNELRRLMSETGRRFKVVLAGLHNVQRFQQIPNQPLAHFGRAIQVGPLEPRAAAALVRKPLAALGFEFESDSDVLRILSYTNYHPGLVQLFCHDLLNHLLSSTAGAPPVSVTRQHVDLVYQRADVRTGIRDRFDWTLALDPRYQAIAWAIIVEQAENPHGTETFSVRKLQALAQLWWPAGFSGTREDELRGLLDEMCGLGVLVGGVEEGFRLRSPNVVRLMGDVEARLLELGQRPAPGIFDTEQLHREFADQAYSPLTLAQERQLLARRWGVALLFGTRALGLDEVVGSLEALHTDNDNGSTLVEQAPVGLDGPAFADWLQSRSVPTGGTRIFVVRAPGDAEVSASLVEVARRHAEKREQAVNTVGRIVVLFDGAATAAWVLEPVHAAIEARLDAVLWLRRWTAAGVRARLERAQLLGGTDKETAVMRATSGWGLLLQWTFNNRRGAGIPQPDHDRFVAEFPARLAQPESTERLGILDAFELAEGTRSWKLLRLLHQLGPAGVPRALLAPDLFGKDLPGVTTEEIKLLLDHLTRVGLVDVRVETGESTLDASTPRMIVAVDMLAGGALFE